MVGRRSLEDCASMHFCLPAGNSILHAQRYSSQLVDETAYKIQGPRSTAHALLVRERLASAKIGQCHGLFLIHLYIIITL